MNSPVVYLCFTAMFTSFLMLGFNRGFEKANRFLAAFLFFSALYSIVLYVFLCSNSVKWIAIFCITFPSFFFLLGPLAYFYVRSVLTDNPRLHKWDYLHFALFFICFTGTVPLLFSSWQFRLTVGESVQFNISNLSKFRLNLFFPYKINQSIRPFQISFYILALWRMVWKYFNNADTKLYNLMQGKLIYRWICLFCGLFTLIACCFSVSVFKNLFYQNRAEFLLLADGMIVTAVIAYSTLIVLLFLFPQIVYGLPLPGNAAATNNLSTGTQLQTPQEKDKKPQLFNEIYELEIQAALARVVTDKSFLHENFTLVNLSVDINLPEHHLSYYFKNILQIKFNDWKNELRIAEAISLIKNGATDNYTFHSLAKQVGFASYNTFLKAFKAKTNCSPNEYLLN